MKKITLSLLLLVATPLCAQQAIYRPTSMQPSLRQFNHPQVIGSFLSKTFQKPKPAPLGKRFLAQLVNAIIISLCTWLISHFITYDKSCLIISIWGKFRIEWSLQQNVFAPIIWILLEIGFIMIGGVGKKLLGIKVVDKEGKEPTLGQAFIRAFAKYAIAGLHPVMLFINILPQFFNEEEQALHDMLAKTYVVVEAA